MSQFKALLFDMDGTLVNTEPLHQEAWFETLAKLDIELPSDWFHKYTGSTDRILMNDIATKYKLKLDIDKMLDDKKNRFLEMAESRSETFKGVVEGLTILQKRYKLALVTSSSRAGAMCVLKSTGLTHFFQTIITFDDVEKHKPDPEPYTKAINFFGLRPEECIAVEDSVSGTMSAKASGCYTIGVLNSVEVEKLVKADKILETTNDVIELINNLK